MRVEGHMYRDILVAKLKEELELKCYDYQLKKEQNMAENARIERLYKIAKEEKGTFMARVKELQDLVKDLRR
jgi:hypothetical protein